MWPNYIVANYYQYILCSVVVKFHQYIICKLLFSFQVVDFLSGKAPLNLTMRLGDHMMLIQLQLSTVNSASNSKRARTSGPTTSSSSSRPPHTTSTSTSTSTSSRTSSERSSPTPSTSSSSSSSFSTPSTSPNASPNASEESASASNYRPKLDTRALTEASKNLTQTLKQLSSEVLTTRSDEVGKYFSK
jgi:hypothetical protein